MKKAFEIWLGTATYVIISYVLFGGGIVLINIGMDQMQGAPDMVLGAAWFGFGWACIATFLGFIGWMRTTAQAGRLKKLEQDLTELYGWRDSDD